MRGIIVLIEKSGTTLGVVLCVLLFALFASHCDAFNEQRTIDNLREEETISLSELTSYSGSGSDIGVGDEKEWIERNYPEVNFAFGTDVDSAYETKVYGHTGILGYRTYCSTYSLYGQNTAAALRRNLNGEFSTMNIAIGLKREDVEKWLDTEYEIHGYCLVFGDNQLLYESSILTPESKTLDTFSVDVSGVDELVIYIVGSAYLSGNVTR